MRLVPRYTLVLGATIAIALSAFAFARLHTSRAQLVEDMRRDHRVVGHLLQAGIADIWLDSGTDPERATRQTLALLARSQRVVTATRFEWSTTDRTGAERQGVEGSDFVSRFPIDRGATHLGTLVAREPLSYIDGVMSTQLWLSVAAIVTIIVICVVLALVMGEWLVGRPVSLLVAKARRIGRQDFSGGPMVERSDELGELARELARAADELSRSIAATSAETEARVAAIEQLRHSDRLATVGKLAAGIAHELGTPLSIVGGHAQMIAGGEVTGDAALGSARAIDKEVTRMGAIVRQLLDFARRKGPEGTTCDPNAVAQRCATLLAVMAERHHVTWEVRETSSVQALIDEDSLQQVLTNLMVNALQAMPTGGQLAVAVSRERAAHAPASTPVPCIRIDVTDTGPGIPPDVQDHMFEPFFTTKQPGDGTGLGLAVVHGIVADHRGWIEVETGEHGTTFSVFLMEAST